MPHPTRTTQPCVACRHLVIPGDLCNHPGAPVDLVHGRPTLSARAMRGGPAAVAEVQACSRGTSMQLCGPAARLFEPAVPPAGSTAALALVAAARHQPAPALATGAEC